MIGPSIACPTAVGPQFIVPRSYSVQNGKRAPFGGAFSVIDQIGCRSASPSTEFRAAGIGAFAIRIQRGKLLRAVAKHHRALPCPRV
jgi:hypothetical protein